MDILKEMKLMMTRRVFFSRASVGIGTAALASLGNPGLFAASEGIDPKTGGLVGLPHFAPKAKRVIFLHQSGAPAQMELFDYKPQLEKFNGTLPPKELLEGYRAAFINPNSRLMGTKFKFSKQGQTGTEISELLPNLSKVVDDIAIVKSMVTDAFNHAPGQLLMNTGTMQFGRPSMGAWALYGLGSETKDLPSFVVFSSGSKGPSGGNSCWGSGFLPTVYQGVQFRTGGDAVLYLSNPPGVDEQLQRDTLATVNSLNKMKLNESGDPEISTRINSFEMAYRMQSSAPDLMDFSKETAQTLEMYGAEPGKPSFANNCLLARRLVERGVRFVQLYHEAWDQHDKLVEDISKNCRDTDKACAALITDLKQRGMLEDTLVIWGGEFGRTPMVQANTMGQANGRDHHPNAFTMWMAGGGIKPGARVGETDDLGFNVTTDKVHVHDLHATILHLLGFDHTKLTFKFQGRNFRLTDVAGNVVQKLVA